MPPRHLVPFLPRASRWLPWLALLAAGHAFGQDALNDKRLADELERCQATMHNDPNQALALADRLLAEPRLPAGAKVGALACRGFSQQLLGHGEASLATAVRLQELRENPALAPVDRKRALHMTSSLLLRNGQTGEALQLLEQMLEQGAAEHDIVSQITALTGIALIRAEQMDDPEGSLHYQKQAIELSTHLQRPPVQQDVMLHYNYGYTLLNLKRYDEAGKAFAQAEALANRLSGQEIMLNRIRGHRAEVKRANGRLDQAKAELLAIAPWQQKNDPLGQAITLQRLARIALDQQQPEVALADADQALAISRSGRFPEAIRDSADLLAEIHTVLGNTPLARDYLRQAREIEQARMKGDNLNRLAKLQAKAEQALAPEQINASQEASRDRLLRNVALVAASLLLLSGGGLYLRMRRQQRRLRQLSTTDALTGLPNRREAERLLDTAITSPSVAARSVLLLEIDDFKAFNDQHGHAAGDMLLCAASEALVQACDQHDLVARWDGATFLVVRDNTSQAAAFALAAHLCRSIERLQVAAAPGQYVTPSISAGVAPHPLFPGAKPRRIDTLRAASRALQVARRSGKGSWAGLWGLAEGNGVDIYSVLHDPEQALAQGWVAIGGGRPMSWAPPRDTGTGPLQSAPAPRRPGAASGDRN